MHQKLTSPRFSVVRSLSLDGRHIILWMRQIALPCLLLLCAANALFLAVRFADNLISKQAVGASLREGYEDGSMTVLSYPHNMLIGRDQYSDCIVAQIAALGDPDPIRDAIAPRLLAAEQVGADMAPLRRYPCLDLKTYVDGRYPEVPAATYTRFWHGASSVLAIALSYLPVDGYRALLLNLTLGLIALTAVAAALAGPRLLIGLSPLLITSFAFNGQLGYGQLFGYGPAQVALWATAAFILLCRKRMSPRNLLLLAVLSGAFEAFFDQLISPPLVLMTFVIVAHLVWDVRVDQRGFRKALGNCLALFAAWSFGFLGSYAFKLVLTIAALGWSPLHEMAQQLAFRVGTVDAEYGYHARDHISRWSMLGDNFVALLGNSWRLGYTGGKAGAADALISCTVGWTGWVLAFYRLFKLPANQRLQFVTAGIPYLVASVFMILWVIALPEHTMRHAFFMVRSATIWITGGWGWLCVARMGVAASRISADARV